MAWEKTSAECKSGTALDPFYSLCDLPPGEPRLLNRFFIRERHGGAVEDSCRNIDDCRDHNLDSGYTASHRPADVGLMGAMSRAVADAFPHWSQH